MAASTPTVKALRLLLLAVLALLGGATSSAHAHSMKKHHHHHHHHHHHPHGGAVRKFEFNIQYADIYPDCVEKPNVVTVNGQFPGPTIEITEGDSVEIHVKNNVDQDISLHWHGFFQKYSKGGNNWHDGPAYITQCPIPPGGEYTYRFRVEGQRGTFFWHGHLRYLLAELFGAFIVHPRPRALVPFKKPAGEHTVLLSAWFHLPLRQLYINEIQTGPGKFAFGSGDALLINGRGKFNCTALTEAKMCRAEQVNCTVQPCDPHNPQCAYPSFEVEKGKTYRFRVVNIAHGALLRFAIAGHNLTIVETDGAYTKPLVVDHLELSTGQVFSVLVTANQPVGTYWILNALRGTSMAGPSLAILRYKGSPLTEPGPGAPLPILPLPTDRDSSVAQALATKSLGKFPLKGLRVTKRLHFVASFATAEGSPITRALINNHSFAEPSTPILAAEYFKIPGVFTKDFPEQSPFNYDTAAPKPGQGSGTAKVVQTTSVLHLPYKGVIEILIQSAVNLFPTPVGLVNFTAEHPFHTHGYSFFILGVGCGTFDPVESPKTYNLVDPAERYTMAVPMGGWVVIRFKADNPGVWNFHCHHQTHMSGGMQTVFIVRDPKGHDLPPPPHDAPICGLYPTRNY